MNKESMHVKNYRAKKVEQGLCICCGQKSPLEKIKTCLECTLKSRSVAIFKTVKYHKDLFRLLEKQNYKCAYTGEGLIIGKNDAIDHKTPESRGGKSTLDNLQWVTREVNSLKGFLTHKEFLLLIAQGFDIPTLPRKEKRITKRTSKVHPQKQVYSEYNKSTSQRESMLSEDKDSEREVITVKQASKLLGASIQTTRDMLKKGEIEGFLLSGNHYRVYVDSVIAHREKHKVSKGKRSKIKPVKSKKGKPKPGKPKKKVGK